MTEDGYDLIVVGAGRAATRPPCARRCSASAWPSWSATHAWAGPACCAAASPRRRCSSRRGHGHVDRSEEWGIQASGEVDWPKVLEDFEEHIVDKKVSRPDRADQGQEDRRDPGHRPARRRARAWTWTAAGSKPPTSCWPPARTRGCSRAWRSASAIVTSDQIWTLAGCPSSVVIIGAGAIGMEFATVFRSFGAKVTVIEALPRIVPLEDEDVSKEAAREFSKRGITTFADARSATSATPAITSRSPTSRTASRPHTVSAELCLVAVGRGPISEGLGLEEAGVGPGTRIREGRRPAPDDRPARVGGRRRGRHAAATGPLVVPGGHGRGGADRRPGVPEIDYAGIPEVTFSQPEISSVGLTEAQARDRGHDVETKKFMFSVLAKANIVGEGGIVKVVAEKDGGQILGVHMIGPHVTELVAEATPDLQLGGRAGRRRGADPRPPHAVRGGSARCCWRWRASPCTPCDAGRLG